MVILTEDGEKQRLHARRQFHGKPRYDLVQIKGEDAHAPWFARLLAIFDVNTDAGWRRLILVHWLERIPVSHVPGAETFRYWSKNPDVVTAKSLVRRARMLTSPRTHGEAEHVCFVRLPYGRANTR